MRIRSEIRLGAAILDIQELCVLDVWELNGGAGPIPEERMMPEIARRCTGREYDELIKLNDDQLIKLAAEIKRVNAEYFSNSKGADAEPLHCPQEKLFEEMEVAIDDLIAGGHGQAVWSYGWSRFVRAHRHYSYSKAENVKSAAVAARTGYHAKLQDFKRWIESGRRRRPEDYGDVLELAKALNKKARKT